MACLSQYFSRTESFLHLRCASFLKVSKRTAFFRKKDKDEEFEEDRNRKYNQDEDGPLLKQSIGHLGNKRSIDTRKAYLPPVDVEDRIQRLVGEMVQDQDWKNLSLEEPTVKYKVLSNLIKEFDHDIPNTVLHRMDHISQAVDYFKKEVKLSISIEDMKVSKDTPKNLHIQTEYIRFNPNTDTMFGGRTAYPGHNTHVTSIKYKRKYASIETEKPKPGYHNRYYGY